MSAEPLAHIARAPLPWRAEGDNDTECGKPVADFARVIPWDEAVGIIKEHGQQRAAFVLCMTCWQTTGRWAGFGGQRDPTGQCTFDGMPTERLSREFGKRRQQTDRELRAMAELVNQHRSEFDDLLAGLVVPIAELRRQRRGQRGERR